MAVDRPTPTCPYCGKPVAKPIYEKYKGLSSVMRPFGDSFIRWKYKKCKCKGARKARKETRNKINLTDSILNKFNRNKLD